MSDEEMKVIRVEFVAREDGSEGGKTEDPQDPPPQHPAKYAFRPKARAQTQRGRTRGKERRRISKFGVKAAIACVICAGCLAISMLDTPFTKKAASVINNILTYNLNIDESIGQLKFVQNIFPGTTAVFGGQTSLRYPCEGNIVAKFGEGDSKGIRIQAAPSAKVTAAADGDGGAYPAAITELSFGFGDRVTLRVATDLGRDSDLSGVSLRIRYTERRGSVVTRYVSGADFVCSETAGGCTACFDGLRASEFRTVLTLTLMQDGAPISAAVQYSLDDYAASCIADGRDGALVNLIEKTLLYADSAKNCFAPAANEYTED